MSDVVVTGGAGFVGKNVCNGFAKGAKVYALDDLSSGSWAGLSDDVVKVELDINDDNLESILREIQPDSVIHCAALFANQRSIDFPVQDLRTNVEGTIRLLECLGRLKKRPLLIYTSSSCVYDDFDIGEDLPFERSTQTPYAISKGVAELYLKHYSERLNLISRSLRLFNIYGPLEPPGYYRNVIPNFIDKALRNEQLCITGSPNATRDFTYVGDLVKLIQKMVINIDPKTKYDAFNVGTGIETRIIDLASIIIEATSSNSEIIYAPSRSWDATVRRRANIKKLVRSQYCPEWTDLRTGIRETVYRWMGR